MENLTPTKFQKIKTFVVSHKKTSIAILIAIIILGYFGYKTFFKAPTQTLYTTGTVEKGSVLVSVTGSGQVSASNQIDLKPKVSGDITGVYVKAGQVVGKGKLLFSLDSRDAEKAVRDAETSLESANLDLEATNSQNENGDTNQQVAVDNAYSTLLNSTPEAVPTDSVFDYTAPVISGYYSLGKEGTIKITVYNSNSGLRFNATGLVGVDGPLSSITPQPLGDSGLYIKFPSTNINVYNWTINIPNTKASNYTSNYNAYQSALRSQAQSNSSSPSTILSIKNKELAVTRAENSLQDAKDALANYYIYAPFNGVIASVVAKVGDSVSGTALGSIITNQKIATISLNEVDIAKIKLGQKVTLTFDAIPELTITGEVAEIDSIGTVTQGVVNYNVKINFDVNDDRVKPGMSVSANIITDTAQDVLVVPNSAVKTQNGTSYVETFSAPLTGTATGTQGLPSATLPNQVGVEIGLVDDTNTEITSGLKEGDIVVTKTTTAAVTTKSTAPSLINAVGGSGSRTGSSTRIGGSAGMAIPRD